MEGINTLQPLSLFSISLKTKAKDVKQSHDTVSLNEI